MNNTLNIKNNTLALGDNLELLKLLPNESIDLIYLDPPFNSNRNYIVVDENQVNYFKDVWKGAQFTYLDFLSDRLYIMRQKLKKTGSLYLHCDPSWSHYIKILLDKIFGQNNFRNEIIWKRKYGKAGPVDRFGSVTDTILYYTKTKQYTFNPVCVPNKPEYIKKFFIHTDKDGRIYGTDNLASPTFSSNLVYDYKGYKPPAKGWALSKEKMKQWDDAGKLHFPKSKSGRIRRKRYLDELKGEEVQNLWIDINVISSQAKERCGYPTQKPLALLERIIKASSNKDDIVLDPFMGCYDKETQVLTRAGWKYFKDTTDNDEFITKDLEENISYQKRLKNFEYNYNGSMLHVKSRSTDLLVTPNHNMYVKSHNDFCLHKTPQFIKAENLNQKEYRIPIGGNFLPKESKISKEMMYLIGLYVSEGYIDKTSRSKNRVIICQNQGEKYDQMWKWLQPLNPSTKGNRRISIRLEDYWFNFVKENCGESKYNKYLSPDILNNKNLNCLYDAMLLGDGHTTKTGYQRYYTVSEKLRDSFEELCLKLGYETSTCTRARRISKIKNREISGTVSIYEINVRKSKHKAINPENHISQIDYNDKVYCVKIPNHTLYVKRNGYCSWCGNSGTTLVAAHNLERRFIGMDMSASAILTTRSRLDKINADYKIYKAAWDYEEIRNSPPFEFEKYIVEELGGIPNEKQRGDFGIDGRIIDKINKLIQVKRSDNIGRNIVDNFTAALARENITHGIICAFSFGSGAEKEVARLRAETDINIELKPIDKIIKVNKPPTLKLSIDNKIISADAKDPDGEIVNFTWWIADPQNSSPYILRDTKGSLDISDLKPKPKEVWCRVTDNSGNSTIKSIKI